MRLFEARFDPERADQARGEALTAEIEAEIDEVQSLDEDRILRSFLAVVLAMLRTNYFRLASDSDPPKPLTYLSFKLDPSRLDMLPRPRPRFEIFVYSPRVEGIHLRGGKVARGGIRWSDRPRGLPHRGARADEGADGQERADRPRRIQGRLRGQAAASGGRADALREEGIACYRTFLSGLLDLTDNYAAVGCRAPRAGRALRRRRPLPGGGR